MGKALAEGGRRDKVVLMSKIDGRSKKACLDQIDQSLARLKTDRIDLMQIHEIIRPGDPAECFKDGGCVEGLLGAEGREDRFLGFTGHKDPSIHLSMIEAADKHGFAFDAVQMPLNVMDAHYRSFEKKVLPVLVEKGIAVLGMKPMGSGIILEAGVCGPVDCLHYAMSLPTSVVITGCDSMGVRPGDRRGAPVPSARRRRAGEAARPHEGRRGRRHVRSSRRPSSSTAPKEQALARARGALSSRAAAGARPARRPARRAPLPRAHE